MLNFFNSDLSYFNFYFLTLILLNIFIYLYLLINTFLILFLFDLSRVKTLNNFSLFNNISFLYISFFVLLLSFAGIPPLLGFLGKFLIFIYLFYKNNIILFILFIFINMFIIYFYLQNLRFLISKNLNNLFLFSNFRAKLNFNCVKYINVFNFFNFFAIIYFEEFIIFFNFIVSNLFF